VRMKVTSTRAETEIRSVVTCDRTEGHDAQIMLCVYALLPQIG